MQHQNLQNTIVKPIITEKALADRQEGRYHFWVDTKANKDQIKNAFEIIFAVKPISIKTLIQKGQIKNDWKKKRQIKKPNHKKAIILIKKDQKINVLDLKIK